MLKVTLLALLTGAISIIRGIDAFSIDVITDDDVLKCNNKGYSDSFDYLILTVSWPQTFCMTISGCKIPQNVKSWTIHGLWPSLEKDSHEPEYCNKTAVFDTSKVQNILNDLNKYWPNLLVDSEYYDFWKHEWCAHGTCAGGVQALANEMDFFNQTLGLYQKYNVDSFLSDGGIIPSKDKKYSTEAIVTAIKQGTNALPTLHCYKVNLWEIHICMSTTSFQPIDCPSTSGSCKGDISYPIIQHE